MYVFDPSQIALRFMGKRLHKIIKEIIDINQSRSHSAKVMDSEIITSKIEELEMIYEEDFNKNIEKIVLNYYYRGQGDSHFFLLPSIFRSDCFLQNEEKMYHELQIKCPESVHCWGFTKSRGLH